MSTSRVVDLIDSYKDAHGVPDAELARRIGISRQNLSLWRTNGFRALPTRANLEAVAAVIGRPYREVLDAALWDSGYAIRSDAAPRAYSEVLADAVYALTEATRLTTFRVRRTAGGDWEPDTAAADPVDWAEFVVQALAGAAANAGGVDAVLAGRPGSWEAGRIGETLVSVVGDDPAELLRHRTEPVEIVIHPERILLDQHDTTWFADYDAAAAELDDQDDAIEPSYVYSWPGHELSDVARAHYATRNVVIVDGPPPEMYPDAEMPTAAARTSLTAAEIAERKRLDDAHDAITAMRERLDAQKRAELAAYGQSIARNLTQRFAALQLTVPVSVTVDLDTPYSDAPQTPMPDYATGIDAIIAAAISETDTPDALSGPPLARLASSSINAPDRPRTPHAIAVAALSRARMSLHQTRDEA